MDNYYGDKYNLDNYYSSQKPERRNNQNNKKTQRKPARVKPKRASGGTIGKKNDNSKKSKKIYALSVSALLVIIVATVGITVWSNRDTTFTFSKNVSVSGIDISGLTQKEARKKVNKNAINTVAKFQINLSAKGKSETLTQEDFEYSFDVKSALKEAKIYSLKEQGKYESTSDTEFTELENPDFHLDYTVKNESVTKNVSAFAEKVNRNYKNARVKTFKPFETERFVYQAAQVGYELVQSDLTARINEFLLSGESEKDIEAKVDILKPKITVDDLKKNIVGISRATSISYNTENGNTNMRVALEACNGSVIEPGELWSFNECTGDSNLEENGYKSATVIFNKELTEGIGGGLCQASTTIFRAAIFANMGIYERHNHYWASSYAYPGEDATIDYPNLDLKLRNTTEYQMFIECKMEGTTLIVNIYGYQEPSYDNVKIYSKNYDIQKGESYKTVTYRVLYLDGEIVKEEVLCYSTYSLKDNASVKTADSGTFRTMVDGTVQYETEPVTETEETTVATEKETKPKATQKATEKTTKPTKATEAPTEKATEEIEPQIEMDTGVS